LGSGTFRASPSENSCPIKVSGSGVNSPLRMILYFIARGNSCFAQRRTASSHLAETDLVTFQGALADRDIPRSYSVSDLHSDLAAMDRILGV